jgi:hypothetical protein
MKIKLFSVLLFLIAFSFNINAQTLFIENFDYPAGDSIGAHGWTQFSGSANTILVKSPGLTYTNYPLSGIGNCCRLRNNGNDNYKNLSDSVISGNIYAAFMVKIDTAKTGDYFFTLGPSSSTTNFNARVYVKDSSGTLSFGVSKGPNAAAPTYGPNGLLYGTTYLVVLKYIFNTGTTTDDELDLYIFTSPTLPSTEPSTPYVGPFTSSTTDATSLGRCFLRQGTATSAPSLDIDGIKVFKTWSNILTSVNTISINIPSDFTLSQNYPNPFNPVTNIRFAIPSNGFVTMKVYNSLGKEVSNLVDQNMNAGTYEVKFDGAKLASGMYFYKMSFIADNGKLFADTKKLMLVK